MRDASNNNNNKNSQGKSTATEKKESLKPLPNRIRKFVDYDLSTMKNSKGGFLLDSKQDDHRKLKEKLQIEELKKQRLAQVQNSDLLQHLLKANPHQSTYSNMMLYHREQVEEYAFSDCKWGSADLLDQEFNNREQAKKDTKNEKFKAQLKDLQEKTRSHVWHKRQDAVHIQKINALVVVDSHILLKGMWISTKA
ncbi:hypothetical protein PSTG_16814 [Puccinia striiformis f. sp. tritici PST-78]|uniref:XPA C-terminal domain-containing protein n=1 Tax=Puccinia striiformis f. sp. tritici PST-78 TaxID=1165861 RepID=A0A0L0US35_9BASI|nr:hypothetical protein PSTG_16814 [Puccinia striiformis f. sp. tritici PST-78]